jgi:small nuclear ribonucleoprotein (snRNP)-like protein
MADNLLDKSLKITLCDERVVYGIFHSMDSKANMIIMDATI